MASAVVKGFLLNSPLAAFVTSSASRHSILDGALTPSLFGGGRSLALQKEHAAANYVTRRHSIVAFTTFFTYATATVGGSDALVEPATNSNDTTSSSTGKTVFVAGAMGNTGKRVVNELLSKGYRVRAGVRDVTKAKNSLPSSANIEIVLADVTDGAKKLAEAIGTVDAVIVATGFRPSLLDPFASWKVDNLGTVNLVDAARENGVKKFVLVSSILVNGAAIGQVLNPVYIILNLLGLTLIAKLQAENYIKQSGIDYTIIRPGGLRSDPPSGSIILAPEDTLLGGSVSRDSVAQVAVDALLYPEASFKVVELISRENVLETPIQAQFAALA